MKDEITITVKDHEGNIHNLSCPLEMGLSLKISVKLRLSIEIAAS